VILFVADRLLQFIWSNVTELPTSAWLCSVHCSLAAELLSWTRGWDGRRMAPHPQNVFRSKCWCWYSQCHLAHHHCHFFLMILLKTWNSSLSVRRRDAWKQRMCYSHPPGKTASATSQTFLQEWGFNVIPEANKYRHQNTLNVLNYIWISISTNKHKRNYQVVYNR
jgi:hypothetical protein